MKQARAIVRANVRLIGVFTFVVCLSISQIAHAIDPNDLSSIVNGTPFYDANAAACLDSAGTTVLVGSDNEQKAYNYIVSQGVNPIGTAGIIGNLMLESGGIDPRVVQAYKDHPQQESDTIPDYAIGNAGFGIAQWTSAGRQQGLIDAAKTVNKVPGDLGVQLDYLWKEATGPSYSKVLDDVKSAKTTDDATKIWMDGYERPLASVAHLDLRQQYARDALAKYGPGNSTGVCRGSTNYVTNFIEYKQCNDNRLGIHVPWADAPYAFGKVCPDGCGPSAMAMIITNMTGQQVTPDIVAAYGAAHGTAAPLTDDNNHIIPNTEGEGGSYGDLLAQVVSEHWHLSERYVPLNLDHIQTINDALRGGALILAGAHGPLPFSDVGHFIVIRAVTPDGKWLVGNSMVGIGNTLNTKYDPVTMVTSNDPTHSNAWIITRQ